MLILHIANKNYSSWSLRPWLLLKTLGIPFEERLHFFGDGAFDFSPTRRVPCLIDGDVTVWDSLAIVEYVAEHVPAVWPADRSACAWARSACAEMHSGFSTLRGTCGMNVGIRVELNSIDAALQCDLDRIDTLWIEGLARFGGPYLAGNAFTAADAFFAPVAYRLQTYGLSLSPTSMAYAERLRALPAMRDWEAAALAEDRRDAAHDAETDAIGRITSDLRAAPR